MIPGQKTDEYRIKSGEFSITITCLATVLENDIKR